MQDIFPQGDNKVWRVVSYQSGLHYILSILKREKKQHLKTAITEINWNKIFIGKVDKIGVNLDKMKINTAMI